MDVRKNILDLNFHKYVQYKTTVLIFAFTYLIALFIPFFTNQLKINNLSDIILISIISSAFFVLVILSIIEFNYHLKKIPEELKKLE